MKTISTVFTLALLAAGIAGAEVPRKVSSGNYAHLWNNSPFTSKPPPVTTTEPISAFDDWALSGVSEVNGGYLVTLQHKKNQGETQVIKPDRTIRYYPDKAEELLPSDPGAFKVDRVEFSDKSWMETVVHLSAGGRNGTVKFDEKATAPKMAAPPPRGGNQQQGGNPQQQGGQPNPPAQGGNPQAQPQQPAQQGSPGVRPPRPRGNR